MRVLRQLLVVLGSLFLLCGGVPAIAETATADSTGTTARGASPAATDERTGDTGVRPRCPTTDRAPSTIPAPDPPLNRYYLGDWRFGPKHLPREGPIARMLVGYHRADGFTPRQFLACYWNDETSGWWYPSPDGWVLINGEPLKVDVTLRYGQKVDLFGTGRGHFLAPAGTPFAKRALPPSNLNTLDPDYPFGYHLYKVVRPFTVEAGPARPWFGQRGWGLQYRTGPTIPQLISDGYLEPLN